MTANYEYIAQCAMDAYKQSDTIAFEQYANQLYNYFVHNPYDLKMCSKPGLIGSVFSYSLSIPNNDEDIQTVRAENAFYSFCRILMRDTDKKVIAAIKLFHLLSKDPSYLYQDVMQLMGAPEFGILPMIRGILTFPKEQLLLISEQITTKKKFAMMKSYLATFFDQDSLNHFKATEEVEEIKSLYIQFTRSNDFFSDSSSHSKGKMFLDILYQDIDNEISQYSQYIH